MTLDDALRFLQEQTPLPDDEDLSDETVDAYEDVRKFLLDHPDPRCIGPLLNSFGNGSGFGVYQLVEDVIKKFPAEQVVPHLRNALRSPRPGVRFWAIQMVPCFRDESVVRPVVENLGHDDSDVRTVAADALALIGAATALPELQTALSKEGNPDVANAIREAIGQLDPRSTANS